MRVKDMFSKKNKIFFYTFFLIFIYSKMVFSETKLINETIEYLESLKFFSGSFVQIEGNEVSEGKLFIGKNRIRNAFKSDWGTLLDRYKIIKP